MSWKNIKVVEPIILESEDYSLVQWNLLCKLFNCESNAEIIRLNLKSVDMYLRIKNNND